MVDSPVTLLWSVFEAYGQEWFGVWGPAIKDDLIVTRLKAEGLRWDGNLKVYSAVLHGTTPEAAITRITQDRDDLKVASVAL